MLWPEVKSAQIAINMNKVAESDGIVTVILSVLDNLGIDQITEVINEISDGSDIREEFNKYIFEARPKTQELLLYFGKNWIQNQIFNKLIIDYWTYLIDRSQSFLLGPDVQ